jgi:hypothetical protein
MAQDANERAVDYWSVAMQLNSVRKLLTEFKRGRISSMFGGLFPTDWPLGLVTGRVLRRVAKSSGHPTALPAPTIVTFGVAEP